MANSTKAQKIAKIELLSKTWEYLNDNFHKFTEDNKIKIAIQLGCKDMPNKIEGEMQFTQMPQVVIGEKPFDINVGDEVPSIDNTETA